ncbi:MAG: major capsid protein [Burkholderiales bacterium]
MATLSTSFYTLLDFVKSLDPDGGVARVIKLLSQTNEVLTDAPAIEGNLPTGHQITQETALPAVYYRQINQGIAPGVSKTAQIVEQTAILEARSQIDINLANLNGNSAAWRLSRTGRHMEAMNQRMSSTLIYGNGGTTPQEFSGLAVRYSSLSAGNGGNIIDAGGTGSDNSSIWLIGWGPETCHLIYPKGSTGGVVHKDLGEQDAFDADNNRFRALMDWWQWQNGLALPDWRYVVRIANIDISNLVAQTSNADLIEKMITAIHAIPFLNMCKPVFYMNRTVFSMLDIQRRNDVVAGGGLKYENVDGVATSTFRGIPVRKLDALIETEARVV